MKREKFFQVCEAAFHDSFMLGRVLLASALFALVLVGCVGTTHGPDKQGEGFLVGAASGAGAGAVTGFQVGAGTGPGAVVGAGFGAVAGAVQGAAKDSIEEDMLHLSQDAQSQRKLATVHEVLQDHYRRRLELHPSRDIFPADLFFVSDHTSLCPSGELLVDEIARMNWDRMAWSRLIVAVYAKSVDPNSEYSIQLVEKRSISIANRLAKAGMDPRRIVTRPIVVDAPILIDPLDRPDRYNEAVEFIPADR